MNTLIVEGGLVKRFLLLMIGIILIVLGSFGIGLPILSYLYLREWVVPLFNLFSLLIYLLYLPFVCWLLVTGIGILARKKWAWYSIQILSIFLVFMGVIMLTVLNSFPFPENFQLAWGKIRAFANLGLIFLVIVIPIFSLVYFHNIRKEKEWSSYSDEVLEELYQSLHQEKPKEML